MVDEGTMDEKEKRESFALLVKMAADDIGYIAEDPHVLDYGTAFALMVEAATCFDVSVGLEWRTGLYTEPSGLEPETVRRDEKKCGWYASVGNYGHSEAYDNPWHALHDGFRTMWEHYVEGAMDVENKHK